jgi:NADH:ubiquinone oxidoreductase subunit K
VAARVVGRRETVAEALPLAAAELAVALAVAVAALRRTATARTPN